jgi:hypothetical protein
MRRLTQSAYAIESVAVDGRTVEIASQVLEMLNMFKNGTRGRFLVLKRASLYGNIDLPVKVDESWDTRHPRHPRQ